MIRRFVWSFAAVLSLVAGSVSSSQAQVLVYKLDFERKKGINYHPFEAGYFVAPLLGGQGSFLLTTTDDGRAYVEAAGGGRLFTAVDGSSSKAVMSATTGTGTAGGSMVAIGSIDHTIHVSGVGFQLSAKVAKTLSGTAVSADDESELDETALNGTIGSAGIAELRLSLDETETRRVNKDSLTLSQTLEYLRLQLERQGYVNAVPDDDDDDDDEEETEAAMIGTDVQVEDILNLDP